MERCYLILALTTLALSSAALADAPEAAVDAISDDTVVDASEVAVSTASDGLLDLTAFEDGGALSDAELGSQRARENYDLDQIVINNQDQDGDVTDNVAVGNTNGDNLINGDAFNNANGFLSTVQNTGNNVLIQNSTIINVSVDTPSAE